MDRDGSHDPPADDPVSVWIVEDNKHLRETLREVVDQDPDMQYTLDCADYETVMAALDAGDMPQLVLTDLELPGMDGVTGIAKLRARAPAVLVIVLTVHEDDERVFEALCAGATGYLLDPASGEAIHSARAGGAPMNAFIASKVLRTFTEGRRPAKDYGLTKRELEILRLLVDEATQKEVAHTLSLSPHTVDTHLRNIYGKLQVRSRSGAVAKALRERLL